MDNATRATLHARLDKILDRRGGVEPVHPNNSLAALLGAQVPSEGDPVASNQLFREGVEFLRDILGDSVRATALQRRFISDDEQRRILRGWVDMLWPLLHVPPNTILAIAPQQELSVFEVLDALSALDAGEIRPLFVANTGKNRRANRWSLARAKLQALTWKKRLVALGQSDKEANYQVTVAFGEQWDTIRKWKQQCEQILGSDQVAIELSYAGSPNDWCLSKGTGIFGTLKRKPIDLLKSAGEAYRTELHRSAELSKRKARLAA